jgi:hypothetical protein
MSKHWWGWGWYSATRFKGRIDDARIYNRALMESEIETLYTQTTLLLDDTAQAWGATVDIRYGPTGLGHLDSFAAGGAYQYRVNIGGYSGGWLSGPSGYVLEINQDDEYAIKTVALESGVPLETTVDIRYGADNDNLSDTETFAVPMGNYQYRVVACGFKGPWTSHSVCSDGNIVPEAGTHVKELQFNFDWTTSKYAKTNVRYVTTFTNCNGTGNKCEPMVAPCGNNIQARPDLGNISPPWVTQAVDCSWNTWSWNVGSEVTTVP